MDAALIVSSFDRLLLPVPTVTDDDHAIVIWLAGDQDLAVVAALHAALAAAQDTPPADRRPVIIDLRGVTFIDTATTRALIDATLDRPGDGPTPTLRAPSECVRRMIEMCGRSDLLDIA